MGSGSGEGGRLLEEALSGLGVLADGCLHAAAEGAYIRLHMTLFSRIGRGLFDGMGRSVGFLGQG